MILCENKLWKFSETIFKKREPKKVGDNLYIVYILYIANIPASTEPSLKMEYVLSFGKFF